MEIINLTVGQLATNCYLLVDPKEHHTLIIDPGDDADYISDKIQSLHLIPKMIIATHGHFDHILGVVDLQLIYRIPFCLNQKDTFLVDRITETAAYFLGKNVYPPKPIIDGYITPNQIIRWGTSELKVLETPGHTPGSICLVSHKDNILFAGDLIFADGYVGRTDFEYADKKLLDQSIRIVKSLGTDLMIYPGHGDIFRV
jgi:hydroxyacylglutathione hydrolase